MIAFLVYIAALLAIISVVSSFSALLSNFSESIRRSDD